MIFRQLLHEERSCASYLVGCPSHGVTAVIDPQAGVSDYVAAAAQLGLRITEVIDTHVHADHESGARALAAATGATLRLGARADVGFDYEPLADGDVVEVGNRRITVMHTPGHTPEHVSLHVDEWFVLTGDTLFVGDVGRVDLALQDVDEAEIRDRARTLHASLQRLRALPPETEVFPGHYSGSTCGRGMDGKPMSTIGHEIKTNRSFGLAADEFVNFQLENLPPEPQDFHRIKRANVGISAAAGRGEHA